MGERKTVSIYTADWVRLSAWQAREAEKTKQTPSFADLVHAALGWVEDQTFRDATAHL